MLHPSNKVHICSSFLYSVIFNLLIPHWRFCKISYERYQCSFLFIYLFFLFQLLSVFFFLISVIQGLRKWITAKSRQSCPTLCDLIDSSPPGSCPWDSPGKNTGVGCHFLQSMKVKSESGVAQSCPTLRDPMDCSLPGSSIHGIFQARVLEWVARAFS